MKYTLTIIIPTYNALRHLKNWEKINITENYKHIEFIFVDSNSNDGSNKYLLFLTQMYENLYVYFLKSSIYEAMNYGVYKSTSNWILFMGIDDILLKSINNLLFYIESNILNSYDLLIIDYQISYNDKIITKKSNKQLKYPHHQSCIFNKETLLNFKYIYNTNYILFSDMDLIFRILIKKKFIYLPYNCVNFSIGGKSTNGKNFKLSFKELTQISYNNNKIFTKFYFLSIFRFTYYFFRNILSR